MSKSNSFVQRLPDSNAGWYALALLAIAVALVIAGAGHASVDKALSRAAA
jgi:uncharacterized membrane protein YphA (DoxX/SURF4 family)